MTFTFVLFCAVLVCANAGLLGVPAVSTYAAGPAFAQAYHPTSALAYSVSPVASTYSTAPAISYSTPALTSQSSNIYRSYGNLGQVSTYSKSIDTPFSSVRKSDVRISNPGLQFAAAPSLAYSSPAIAHAAPLGVAYSAAPAVSHINFNSGYASYAL